MKSPQNRVVSETAVVDTVDFGYPSRVPTRLKTILWLAKWIVLALAIVIAAAVLPPLVFIGNIWMHDIPQPLTDTKPGYSDASRMDPANAAEVIPVSADPATAEKQLAELVARATREGQHISISGARHSMGGHARYPGGITLDMLPFNRMSFDRERAILTVGSGALWMNVIRFLDENGFAVKIMQSNSDFSVGGSISVNCHGWQHESPPIASTVASFRLLRADGTIVRCSEMENSDLFRNALGGYGLFGVILDVNLHVVPNEFYRAKSFPVTPAGYAEKYATLMKTYDDEIGMAYGRISVAPASFLEEGAITLLLKQPEDGRSTSHTLPAPKPAEIKRIVFRGSVGSSYGKNLRWALERLVGEDGAEILSRNPIMDEPAEWFSNRDPNATEILHEYFVPPAQFSKFIEVIRPILLKHHADLLNITVRNVKADTITKLPYARQEVFGLVMLFHQGIDGTSEAAMKALASDMIDAVLRCDGTYYLPYRPHASPAQFTASYPGGLEFFKFKRANDPHDIFSNNFYRTYGGP